MGSMICNPMLLLITKPSAGKLKLTVSWPMMNYVTQSEWQLPAALCKLCVRLEDGPVASVLSASYLTIEANSRHCTAHANLRIWTLWASGRCAICQLSLWAWSLLCQYCCSKAISSPLENHQHFIGNKVILTMCYRGVCVMEVNVLQRGICYRYVLSVSLFLL